MHGAVMHGPGDVRIPEADEPRTVGLTDAESLFAKRQPRGRAQILTQKQGME